MTAADLVLERLLGPAMAAEPIDGAHDWVRRHDAAAAGLPRGVARALAGGAVADRIGWAFASGYRAALQRALPALDDAPLTSLCASEEGGAHPRSIQTILETEGERPLLRGGKKWATLAPAAQVLLVVARTGEAPDGRPMLRVVRVDARAPGVTIQEMPPTPFAPEIAHGLVRLDGVSVAPDDVLPGDAWETLLRPFRTVEDTHVLGALTGFLLGEAGRDGWPRSLREDLAGVAAALIAIGESDPASPGTHVALEAATRAARHQFNRAAARLREPARQSWERDRALLDVAATARARRIEVAWEKLGS